MGSTAAHCTQHQQRPLRNFGFAIKHVVTSGVRATRKGIAQTVKSALSLQGEIREIQMVQEVSRPCREVVVGKEQQAWLGEHGIAGQDEGKGNW